MADTLAPQEATTPHPGHEAADSVDTHATHRWALSRHFGEMVVAMWVGMALGGLLWAPILDAAGMTSGEARIRYPEAFLLVMALNMTIPMVGWMRFRGHGWRSCLEMGAAMVVPGVLVLGAFWLGVTDGPACGLYCLLMILAMAVAVRLRREEYGG